MMQLPDYIPLVEVQRVCQELGLRDWTALTESTVLPEEAAVIRNLIGGEALLISPEEFQAGLEVELEHGRRFPDTNVTNNHPILTGKIVVAHLKESLDYYRRLEIAELEADLLKAVQNGDSEKATSKYKRLAAVRLALALHEAQQLDQN
jgi:hypothetical protein